MKVLSRLPCHSARQGVATFLASIVVVCTLSSQVFAAGEASSDVTGLQIHGFGSVGVAYVDAPDGWNYTRSINQQSNGNSVRADVDSRIGLQLNYQPSERIELVGQIVASRLNDNANVGDALGMAFIAFRPDGDWTLRMGRVNLDAYSLSDHRDVGFAYEFIRPPVEFYSRTPTFLDGADLSRVWTTSAAQWRGKIFGGRSSGGTGDGRLRLEPLFGAMLLRDAEGLQLRVSAVHARTANVIGFLKPLIAALEGVKALPVPSVAAQADALENSLEAKGVSIAYFGAAARYDRHDWLFSAEINRGKVADNPHSSFTTGYASVGRRFGRLTAFAVASAAVRDADGVGPVDWATPLTMFGPAVALQAQAVGNFATDAVNKAAGQQTTTSVGVRCDLNSRVALKAQWDYIHTEANGGALWNESSSAAANSNVFGIALDFVF